MLSIPDKYIVDLPNEDETRRLLSYAVLSSVETGKLTSITFHERKLTTITNRPKGKSTPKQLHPRHTQLLRSPSWRLRLPPGQKYKTTGTLGSPSATTTIDGNNSRRPTEVRRVINLDAQNSKPYWPARVVPPKGAPNVLLIMTDDQSYGVSGFSEVRAKGVQLLRFH